MYKVRVSSKGQIAIPAALRKQYDIQQGDNLIVKESEEGFMVLTLADKQLLKLRGKYSDQEEASLTESLLNERKAERQLDK